MPHLRQSAPGAPQPVDSRALHQAQKRAGSSGLPLLWLGGAALARKLVHKMIQAGCPAGLSDLPPPDAGARSEAAQPETEPAQ